MRELYHARRLLRLVGPQSTGTVCKTMNEGDQRGRRQSEAMFDVCTKLACAASNIASLNIIFSPFDQLVQFVLISFVLTICRLNAARERRAEAARSADVASPTPRAC